MSDAYSETPYIPESDIDRRALAAEIIQVLTTAEFFEEWHGEDDDPTKERTFTRAIDDRTRVIVYTSIVGREHDAQVRDVGKDAIRVCGIYKSKRNDKDHGIVRETRIHRTGTMAAICDRLLKRMRSVWKKASRPVVCPDCGAPTFRSKKGHDVCVEFCWKSDEELARGNAEYQSKRRNRNPYYGGRRRY